MMRHQGWILLLLIGLPLPLLAQPPVPRIEPAACWMPLQTLTEGLDIACSYLIVPENRADPNSPTLKLAFAVLYAAEGARHPDPLLYLEGGPGGGAVALAEYWPGTIYTEGRDVILLDQRGTGYSQPSLNCPEVERGEADGLRRCHKRLRAQGVNLNAYTSAENAADVADLRRALGYTQWNLLGISYGTRLALTVMRDHPEGLRSVILDSVYPPHINFWLDYGRNTDRVFRLLFDLCAADRACAKAYPNLETVFYDTVARLNAEPAAYTVYDPESDTEYDAEINGDDLIDRVYSLFYDTASIPYLPQTLYAVAAGDYAALDALEGYAPFTVTDEQGEDVYDSEGLYYAVECGEELSFTPRAEALAALPPHPPALYDNGVLTIKNMFDSCADWPVDAADPRENQPVRSDIPTLVLAGQFDPVTPPDWARSAAEYLSRSFYFELPGTGHGVVDSGKCPARLALAFLNDPLTAPDPTCLSRLSAIQWALPGG